MLAVERGEFLAVGRQRAPPHAPRPSASSTLFVGRTRGGAARTGTECSSSRRRRCSRSARRRPARRSASHSGLGPTFTLHESRAPSNAGSARRRQRRWSHRQVRLNVRHAMRLPARSAFMSLKRVRPTGIGVHRPHLARQARHGKAVGAVRRDFQVEHRVGQASGRSAMGMADSGASSGSTQMPSWSVPMPSSRFEQHMPHSWSTPRSFDFLMVKPAGISGAQA